MRAMPIVLVLFSLIAISPALARRCLPLPGLRLQRRRRLARARWGLRAKGVSCAGLWLSGGGALQAGRRKAHLLRQAIGAHPAQGQDASAIASSGLAIALGGARKLGGVGWRIVRV